MNNHPKQWFGPVFWGCVGLCLLYLVGKLLITEYRLGKSETIFNRLKHPDGTSRVDRVSLRYSYYPATYVDDSIDFTSANLVGELRSYSIDWDEITHFYTNRRLEISNGMDVLPIEIRKNDEYIWLDIPEWFLISPGHHDILEAIREEYDFWGWPEGLNGRTDRLYLVYVLGP